MSAISDFLSSAFSELFYEKDQPSGSARRVPQAPELVEERPAEKNEGFRRKGYDTMPEPISAQGSLAEFDRVLSMLESGDSRVTSRALSAIEGISDDNRLACIAIFSKNPEARKAALDLVGKKPYALAVIFSESLYRDTKGAAMTALSSMVEGIAEQRVLAVLASNHKEKRIRMRALSSVKEIKWLLDIAYASRFEDSRWEAIERLRDMNVDIDKEDLRHDETLSDLADQLVRSSTPEEDVVEDMEIMLDNIRYLQGSRGKRSDAFSDVIRDNMSAYVNTLKSIATSCRHSQARELALSGLEDDPALLAEVAQHGEYEDTASQAVDKIAANVSGKSEPQCLALVGCMSGSSEKRARAVSKLDNAEMLKHVVKYSQFEDSRIAAAHKLASMISQLEDPESLRLVIAYAKESKNRDLAERRIAELEGAEESVKKPPPLPEIRDEPARKQKIVFKEFPEPAQPRPKEEPAGPQQRREEPPRPQPRRDEPPERVTVSRPPEPPSAPSGGLWGAIKELIGI